MLLRQSFKSFLDLKSNVNNELFQELVGDLQQYIQIRATNAKVKINQRLQKSARSDSTITKLPRLFPNINLIPALYFKVLNTLGSMECPACQQKVRLTWYHLPIHGIVMRNPSLVIPYKINQWEQTKSMPHHLKIASRYQLKVDCTQWTAQVENTYKSSLISLMFLGHSPLK